jgi:hypothetical protein
MSISTFSTPELEDNLSSYEFVALKDASIPSIFFAVGLEMEATYVLNPLSTKEWNLKTFYVPNIAKIIRYIEDSEDDKYPFIYEAEVSGRKCAGVSIIEPDPRHSMLEIATSKYYGLVQKAFDKTDILYYAQRLIDIQKGAIEDLNNFYKNEKLWKKKTYNSIVPYPYAMSDRLKNADIVLGNMKNTKNKTNYTGSYHVTLTLPFSSVSNKEYYDPYKKYINQFQWIEPLIIAFYTTTDMRGIGSKTKYSRASYRILLSGWGNPAGSDVRKFDQGLTRKVNIPLYWRKGLDFPGQKKLQKYCADEKKKYALDYVDPDRDLYDMGGDFRTPSGEHGQEWDVRDRLQGKFSGVEMRILDYFPPKYMASFLRILSFIAENSRRTENKMYVYEDKDWIKTIQSVFKSGWRAKIPIEYINKLEKALDLTFPKKPLMLDSFFDVFLETLYKRNRTGFYVNELLPQMIDGEDNFSFPTTEPTTQPPLVKKNPNRESWDFGFLLKLSDSQEIRNKIKKMLQSLPVGKAITKTSLKKHYKNKMPASWQNNMLDMMYFFEKRDGLTINTDKDGFLKSITKSETQHNTIPLIIDNYIGSIVRLWPELIR